MDARNFAFMFYGFLAAWLILVGYVLSLVAREGKLRSELRRVQDMLDVSPERKNLPERANAKTEPAEGRRRGRPV